MIKNKIYQRSRPITAVPSSQGNSQMLDIVFWQRFINPHIAGMVRALAAGGTSVTYVAERTMSEERSNMGWQPPETAPARFILAEDKSAMLDVLSRVSRCAVHICHGIRSNGPIHAVQRELARTGMRQWALMETVDDEGVLGVLKRFEYARICRHFRSHGEGILAIGHAMPAWLEKRGVPRERIAPFAYFLSKPDLQEISDWVPDRPFRIAFVGQLIALKRVEDLIEAAKMSGGDPRGVEVCMIGDGPEAGRLRRLADAHLPGQVRWHGMVDQTSVFKLLAQVDLLVLPSRHDGWGAVVTEALLAGTPAICTDRCGAAGVVEASGVGGVYHAGNVPELANLLAQAMRQGRVTPARRGALRQWAEVLSADSGAAYLREILNLSCQASPLPPPPWISIH